MERDTFSTAVGIDYTHLQELLEARSWREADLETLAIILKIIGTDKATLLSKDDIENFPCQDLHTLNRLWVCYSNGRFGFSVQTFIWQSLGGTKRYDQKIERCYFERVGWSKDGYYLNYDDLTFNINDALGHLPYLGDICRIQDFFARCQACQLSVQLPQANSNRVPFIEPTLTVPFNGEPQQTERLSQSQPSNTLIITQKPQTLINVVDHLSRQDAIEIVPDSTMAIISINHPSRLAQPAQLQAGWASVLRLAFHDLELNSYGPTYPARLFRTHDALTILNWLSAIEASEVNTILVHCEAGISRSAAIAKFLAERYRLPLNLERASRYNRRVYQLLKEVEYQSQYRSIGNDSANQRSSHK